MKITYLQPEKNDWFLISWTITNKCNYRCSYCPSFLHDGSSGWPEWESVKKFVENINIPGKNLCFRISGGEPTFWKRFDEFAELIKSKGYTFSFLTNGSQSPEYYSAISKHTDGVMFSYHAEQTNEDNFVKAVAAMTTPVIVNLMMLPDQFDRLLLIAKRLYELGENVTVWPKLILDKSNIEHITNKVAGYTNEQLSILNNWPYFRPVDDSKLHRGPLLFNNEEISGNELILKGLNNHKGWQCWAGLHMLAIDQWGDIYRADCQQGGKLGNITEYVLPTSTYICQAEKCSCLGDVYLKKCSR